MLDIKFIKENKDVVASACKNKNRDINLDELLALYEEKKALRSGLDELNKKRNEAAQARNQELGSALKAEAEGLESKFAEIDKKYLALMLKVPNIASPDTPIGPDESANKVIRTVGEIPKFDFPVKDHIEIGANLGIIDTETASEVSGSRFTYLKGDLALLQFALVNFCFETLTSKETLEKIAADANIQIDVNSFIPVIPPLFIKPAVMNRMARLEPREERYHIVSDDQYLIGSSEHTMGPMHMDHVFEEKDLPIRYAGYSASFRREAGAAGKDTRGILRLHQFDKIEMEVFSLPENGIAEQNFLVAIQEYIMQALKLPYQVIICCTGDMGDPDYRHIDIETWMPGQNKYRETHSSDNMAGYQARRLATRAKRADGKIEPVHMNDATVLAIGRALIAIIENYQTADGRVVIPEVLRKYMFGKEFLDKIISN